MVPFLVRYRNIVEGWIELACVRTGQHKMGLDLIGWDRQEDDRHLDRGGCE